jgi:hypothetical protein
MRGGGGVAGLLPNGAHVLSIVHAAGFSFGMGFVQPNVDLDPSRCLKNGRRELPNNNTTPNPDPEPAVLLNVMNASVKQTRLSSPLPDDPARTHVRNQRHIPRGR